MSVSVFKKHLDNLFRNTNVINAPFFISPSHCFVLSVTPDYLSFFFFSKNIFCAVANFGMNIFDFIQ